MSLTSRDEQAHRLTEELEKSLPYAIEFLSKIVRIPTVAPLSDKYETTGEAACQDYIAEVLKGLGLQVDIWEPDAEALAGKYRGKPGFQEGRRFKQRPNLAATWKGTGGGKSMMLAGHIDVVTAGTDRWRFDPWSATVDNGRLYGRGAADMKGGIAASYLALLALRRAGIRLRGDVVFASVVDEEVGGMGTLALVDRGYKADVAIMTEPTGLAICPVVRGILWARITVTGRTGHIEEPFDPGKEDAPIDAIEKGRLVLGAIDSLNQAWNSSEVKKHPLIPIPNQVKVSMIQAGSHPSSYADTFVITIDVQYLTTEEDSQGLGGRVKAEIEGQVARFVYSDPWLAAHPPQFDWFVDADPGEVSLSHPIIPILKEALSQTQREIRIVGKGAHTDMSLLTRLAATPTITFGPAEPEQAHQTNESVAIGDVLDTAKVIALTTLNWCEPAN
jgi:acetylornithine deacetylase